MRPRANARIFTALILAAVLGVTLIPAQGGDPGGMFGCLVCGRRGLADAIANLALFVPVGATLYLALASTRQAFLLSAGLSLCIELAQNLVPGRDPSAGDLLFNSLGAAVGVAAARHSAIWLYPGERRAGYLLLSAVAAAFLLIGLTGFLLEPSIPRASYHVEWNAPSDYLAWYQGRVLEAHVGAASVEPGPLENSRRVRSLLLAGAPLEIVAIAGPRTPSLAQLLGVYDDEHPEVLLVGPERDDLVIRYLTRADDYLLYAPDRRLRNGLLGVSPGDTVRIEVQLLADGYAVALADGVPEQRAFTVGDGWTLLLAEQSAPVRSRAVISLLWVAALTLPIGLWLRANRRSLLIAALFVGGLFVAPAVTTLAHPSPADGAAVVLGIAIGVVLQRSVGRRRRGSRWGIETS